MDKKLCKMCEYSNEDENYYVEFVKDDLCTNCNDNIILETVYSLLSDKEIEFMKEELEYNNGGYNYEIISRKPKCELTYSKKKGDLMNVYVDQTTNGGYTGDDFAGKAYIQIGRRKYFKYDYWL